jgi:radical SAM superfamily enzyme
VEKVFLLDSNAMIMKTADLLTILKACYDSFPQLRQVSCYACSSDILNKSPSELESLYRAGLNLVYLGLESGAPEVLVLMNKGAKVDKQVEAVLKAKSAGIRTSVSVILGLGGRKYSLKHSKLTGEALSMMAPTYSAALTLMVVPGTVLDRMIQEGGFDPVDEPAELLNEARVMIDTINVNEPVVFRANHASNYFAVAGTLPHEKKRMLQSIETAIENSSLLRPENSRRL